MGKNICKQCNQREINLQNIQTACIAQQQNNKESNFYFPSSFEYDGNENMIMEKETEFSLKRLISFDLP